MVPGQAKYVSLHVSAQALVDGVQLSACYCLSLAEFDNMYVDRRLDTGTFYADAHGSIAMQPIKLCPGAAACNNVALLQPLPLHTLMATDAFGRSVAMLAAMFNRWAVLQHLLRLPGGIDWSAIQDTQVTRVASWSSRLLPSLASILM